MNFFRNLFALLTLVSLPLQAADLSDLTYTTTNGEVGITDCNEAATGELVIPNTIEGNPVTSIGEGAFFNCTSLTSITIPDSVTSIGDNTFSFCRSLESINVINSNLNFRDVNGVLFDAEMETLLRYPAGKIDLSYNIPSSVTSIGVDAFADCTSLTSMTIPDSVTSIDNYAFYECRSLTSITIGNGVTSIGQEAFYGCTSLTSITFQGAAPTVGINALFNTPDGAAALVTIETLSSFGGFGTNWNGLTVSMSASYLNGLSTQVATEVATARTAGQGDVTSDPDSYGLVTQASYNAVVAERDTRFTEDQINAMTTDPTIGRNAAGNMQVDISFIHSTDLQTFTPFAVNPAWVSVVDGKIALEFPPSNENTFFYRLGVQ